MTDINRGDGFSPGNLIVLKVPGLDTPAAFDNNDFVSLRDLHAYDDPAQRVMLIDAAIRWIPGVLNDDASAQQDSFVDGLLDCPHYSRPEALDDTMGGLAVPEVLLSGNHAAIRRWRKRQAVARTLERRPDLLASAALDEEERDILRELVAQDSKGVDDGRH